MEIIAEIIEKILALLAGMWIGFGIGAIIDIAISLRKLSGRK